MAPTAVLVEGPAWAAPAPTGLTVLNPLRVEGAIFNLVDRFLPGVISTTPHARYLGLHGLVRTEVVDRGLDAAGAQDLMRRCEAVIAAVTIHHEHLAVLPEGHGQSKVTGLLTPDDGIDVASVAAMGAYSEALAGFFGTYRGPEIALGVIAPGASQEPGARYSDAAVRPGLGEVLELAAQDHLSGADLKAAGHLCPCAATGDEATWLRSIVCGTAGGEEFATYDQARRDTARIVVRLVNQAERVVDIQSALRRAIAFGPPLHRGLLSGIDLAEGWRGAILRNASIEAWRNIWWWLVRELREPASVSELAAAFVAELPADWTVSDLLDQLPHSLAGDELVPVELELRAAQPKPHPLTELRLLALGARRLEETTGRTQLILMGGSDDDLNPSWVESELRQNALRPLRAWAAELVERLLWRSHRIALSKLDTRDPSRPRLPAQVVERDGLWSQQSAAGYGPVGLRLQSFTSMLAGCGVLSSDSDGWRLTAEGRSFLD